MRNVFNLSEKREAKRSDIEKNHGQWTIELGNLAIEKCQLGINDSITHLCDYINRGEESLAGIKADIETDIAERLKDDGSYLVNKLQFNFIDSDFISTNDQVSMKKMTENSLNIMQKELINQPEFEIEIKRAEAEIEEVNKLTEWFKLAQIGANLVFESLPIGQQEYAFTRIYQKTTENTIEGCFLSLHNPSIDQFNDLRIEFGAPSDSTDEIQMLKNYYEISNQKISNTDDVISCYVGIYDQLLSEKNNKQYSFGIENDQKTETYNGIEKVKIATAYTDIYIDAIKSIKKSDGIATSDLMFLNRRFGQDKFKLKANQKLTTPIIRNLLDNIINDIACTIDKSNMTELEVLVSDKSTCYDTVSNYGNSARANGEVYESIGCPKFVGGQKSESTNESDYDILSTGFGSMNRLKNFGQESIDVCRINNCPSRGEVSWLPDKTRVGGCSVCVNCHVLFQNGKDPKMVYNEIQKEELKSKLKQADKHNKNKKIEDLTIKLFQYKKLAENGSTYYLDKSQKIENKINIISDEIN